MAHLTCAGHAQGSEIDYILEDLKQKGLKIY